MQWISICRDVLSFGVSSLTAQEFTSLGAGLRTASWQQRVPKDRSHGMSFTSLFPGLRAQDTHVYLLHTWMFLCFHADTGVYIYIYYICMWIYIIYTHAYTYAIYYIYIYLFVCLFIYLLFADRHDMPMQVMRSYKRSSDSGCWGMATYLLAVLGTAVMTNQLILLQRGTGWVSEGQSWAVLAMFAGTVTCLHSWLLVSCWRWGRMCLNEGQQL
jgi:hypothetical protein